MKINLDKLQQLVDELIETETPETIKKWFEDDSSPVPKVYVAGEENKEEAVQWLRDNNYVPCSNPLRCGVAILLDDYLDSYPKPIPEIDIPMYFYIFLKNEGIYAMDFHKKVREYEEKRTNK